MAQRKKRATVRRRKSTAHGKTRKATKSARGKATKRTVAKLMRRKGLGKAKRKSAGPKKVARKQVRLTRPPSIPAVETVIVDVIEEPVPGVMVVTEFEATEVRGPGVGPAQPEEGQGSTPAESEGQ